MLVECVPNFSEGRDRAKVDSIATAIARHANVLDVSMDPDHNRSVITFAGSPDHVIDGAVEAAGAASELINLRTHQGVHPRIGALDVLPFVPLAGLEVIDCAALADRAARRIWERHRIPCYFYEANAQRPDRRNLADLRRGPLHDPDVGDIDVHSTAGAIAVGARKFLIAYNINLRSNDLAAAKTIARRIRESSGGLPCVKALGLRLESRGIVQVSMNLTDYEVTPIRTVWEAVQREAAALGVEILESELVGVAPRAALDESLAREILLRDFRPSRLL